MAARDWSATPLGPPGTWPSRLRDVVGIMMTSRFSMWAAWGPELTMFYNDAYRHDTLQAKHPWALGRPASEVWAEIWPDIGPRIRSVLDTGVATWDEDLLLFLERSGYPEETYHTFSYSPLGDRDGRAEGVLCVVTENTERVVGERRMATLRDLAAALSATRTEAGVLAAVTEQLGRNPADLPFAVTYLLDETGTARLGSAAGITPGAAATPLTLAADDPDAAWPVQHLSHGEQQLVGGLGERFPDLPTGAWQRPPAQAVCVPIASSGQERGPVSGFLVVGLSPHRSWDDQYRGFVELVAGQIAAGLLNAGTHQAERRRAEALTELDRAKTDFFSNVSHEFRTPLTLIVGPLGELQATPELAAMPRVRQELEVIDRNAQRLGKLVNTLLDFSRLQAGRVEARFEPVELGAATAELASVFRSAVERAGLDYHVDCPALDEPVYVDRDMWEKVVLNLLSNALKFTFAGDITVRLRRVGDHAQLTVSDTGAGIPTGQLDRLFERFHRVANARSRSGEGTGIGLAMVRELLTLHGGTIGVESSPGEGAAFTVTLPFGAAHLPADQIAPPSPGIPTLSPAVFPFVTEALRWLPRANEPTAGTGEPAGTPAGGAQGAGGRVLVADDNADMRDYVTRLLSPHHSVVAVPDGQTALDAILGDPPDLVVSDVMMPGLDGMQLLAALRADPRTARVPVVLLSARAGQQAAVEGLAAGADDYLVKPFSAQELLARVGAHLHLGRARRAAEERFSAMADLAPALIWVADHEGRRVFVNRGWTAFTGDPDPTGHDDGWPNLVHPDDEQRYRELVSGAGAGQQGWEVEFRLRRSDGAYRWLLERAVPIGSGSAFAGYVGSATDINARYRETERQALLADVGAALDREHEVNDLLAALVRSVVRSRLTDLCTVRTIGDDGLLRTAAVAAVDPASETLLRQLDPQGGLGPEVLRTGRSVLHTRREGAPSHPGWAVHDSLRTRSAVAAPLSVRGRVLAVLALGRRDDAAAFDDDDRALVEEVAARAALAVDNALLLADERAATRRLTLLQRITAELSAAMTPVEVAVAAAEHLRQVTGDQSRVAVYEIDAAHRALSSLTFSGGLASDHRLWSTIPLNAAVAVARAAISGRPLWIEDVAQISETRDLPPEIVATLHAYGLRANIALPLVVAGRLVGVIGIGFRVVVTFSAADRGMLLAVAEQCAQALDRARMYRAERGIAATLQRSLLPASLPTIGRLALAAHYLPGAEGTRAGGDWYDVVELGDDRVAIAVGDVVGQGPAAAAVMGQLRSALSVALLEGHGPADALALLDRFASRVPGALASSAACLILDAARGTIVWSRAGHPPPLLVGPDRTGRFLDGDGSGVVLGVPDRPPFTEGSCAIEPGTTLLLYTDGLVERRDEVLDEGLARIRDVAAGHADADPVRLTEMLLREVLAETEQPDDVALIAARLLPAPLAGRLPADPGRLSEVRRDVAGWAAATGLPADLTSDLQLALGEALANSVEHAYAHGATSTDEGACEYSVRRSPEGSIEVSVLDRGVWRPPPTDRGFRGRGLELIAGLAEGVEVTHPPSGGTCVSFRFAAVTGEEGPASAATPEPGSDGFRGVGTTPATVRAHDVDGALQLSITGELDLAAADALRYELLDRLTTVPAGGSVVVELCHTTYLASAGIGLLLQARAALIGRGAQLWVRTRPGSAPERILAVAGLADDLSVARPAPTG